ncbi:ROK family protein [Actinomyces ruminicola]|uniref:Glucokinase n=1 Tax=Actinomyces ruminicola TaxID=332524 RepID=A0A1G9RST2_9ACTO|nr:ROK family protein [Actinomyces ruminicola]SDM26027.1 glucokinase [Actinomyces ruminicola]
MSSTGPLVNGQQSTTADHRDVGDVGVLDIGGTWIRAARMNPEGEILARARRETPGGADPASVIDACVAALAEAGALAEDAPVGRIGVSVTGPVDPRTGTLFTPPNTDANFDGLELGARLREATGLPVAVDKDTNAAALAEHAHGAARQVADFIYLTLSTGVGGAAMIDGRLLYGCTGTAGEIGHMSLDPAGPRCGCGRAGCLEAYASGPALARRAVEFTTDAEGSPLNGPLREHILAGREVTGAQVDRFAVLGDQAALRALDDARHALCSACVDLANVFSPRLIVVGGSVAAHHEDWLGDASRAIRASALAPSSTACTVVPAQLGDDVSLIGASLLGRR